MKYKWNRNCKSFPGIYACEVMTAQAYKDCKDCKFYEPISKKILIIKLGAIGDVLRTTPILKTLKEKYGKNIHISWLVKEESKDLLKNNPLIDRILTYSLDSILRLQYEKFDILLSLEVDIPGIAISNLIKADKKYGYFLDKDGHPNYFNEGSKFYLERVFSNYINKSNKKNQLEMLHEIIELPYKKQDYILNLTEEELSYGEKFKKNKLIGINISSGDRWSNKSWDKNKIIELVKKIKRETNYSVILLGGKQEESLLNELKRKILYVTINNPENTLREFASTINQCDIIVTGDTLALHLALALKKKTIALFFCTPDWEIENFDYLKKIVSPLLLQNFFSDEYNKELVNSISTYQVFQKIKEFSQ